jgi:asparagine synthase (glutamine-hydrolysing)
MKWILRKSMEQRLPPEITWRKGKIGFEPPQNKWMHDEHMREMIMAARKQLVEKKVLKQGVLGLPVSSAEGAQMIDYDWRYLCAAQIFGK